MFSGSLLESDWSLLHNLTSLATSRNIKRFPWVSQHIFVFFSSSHLHKCFLRIHFFCASCFMAEKHLIVFFLRYLHDRFENEERRETVRWVYKVLIIFDASLMLVLRLLSIVDLREQQLQHVCCIVASFFSHCYLSLKEILKLVCSCITLTNVISTIVHQLSRAYRGYRQSRQYSFASTFERTESSHWNFMAYSSV